MTRIVGDSVKDRMTDSWIPEPVLSPSMSFTLEKTTHDEVTTRHKQRPYTEGKSTSDRNDCQNCQGCFQHVIFKVLSHEKSQFIA